VIVFRLYFAGLEQVLDLDFPVRIGSDVCGPTFFGASRLVAPTPRLVVFFLRLVFLRDCCSAPSVLGHI
jgi:hypothetical protein